MYNRRNEATFRVAETAAQSAPDPLPGDLCLRFGPRLVRLADALSGTDGRHPARSGTPGAGGGPHHRHRQRHTGRGCRAGGRLVRFPALREPTRRRTRADRQWQQSLRRARRTPALLAVPGSRARGSRDDLLRRRGHRVPTAGRVEGRRLVPSAGREQRRRRPRWRSDARGASPAERRARRRGSRCLY